MAKQYISLLVFFFFICSSKALPSDVTSLPDSLSVNLNSSNIEVKIQAYCEGMKYYIRVMPDKSFSFGEKALQIARARGYRKGEADILYLIGVSYHAQSDYTKSMEYYQRSYEIRKEIKDNVGIGQCLNRIGLIYNVRGNYEKALDYCLQSVSLLEHENDKKSLGESYNHLGIIYYILNDIPKAKEMSLKALKFCETINADLILAVSHEHLGIIYIQTRENDKAIYHIQKALDLRQAKNDRVGIAGSYENLAIIYRNTKKYDKALEYFNKSLNLKKKLNNQRGVASTVSGIGVTYFNMEQYDKALIYLTQALEMRKRLGDKRGIVSTLNRLANTYAAMGNYKSALSDYKLAKIYGDSLLNEQKNKAIAEIQEAFHREKREKEILLLQKENTSQKNLRNSLLIITLLISVISISIFMAYRSKRKVNSILIHHNNEVTEQKEGLQRLNEELSETKVKLEKINSEKDKFFSIIAHDLRSPFQGFIGITQIMAEDINYFSQAEISELSKDMHNSSKNLLKLLVNLLDWARMQQGSASFDPAEFLLSDIVSQNIDLIIKRGENKGIGIISEVPGDLTVYADEAMLNSILRNLLSNAIKFTKHGGKVTVSAKETENNMLEISVTDSGIGMPDTLSKKIFNIEEKVGRKGTDGELSTGLGLLLCKEFVEKHGGKIWAESRENIGSTFYFTLARKSANSLTETLN